MSTYIEKSFSLVEKKKQQWAKEREELARISGYWRQSSEPQYIEGFFDRHRYASNSISMVHNNEFEGRSLKEPDRRSSLPPLYKNQYNSNDRYDREKEQGGETSGYGSDNSPEYHQVPWSQSGYESSSSRDDRPKWGDKGVVVGKFWTPKEDVPEKNPSEPPNWVKRGLQDGKIVVSNQSPAESPEQTYEDPDRPSTGCSSNINRSYIRGQNIPLDSLELAERERKRQIALEHQQAIRQQLEERERKRIEERERKIQEEREEELRIEREQEIERKRQEHEQKLLQEKLEREKKRKEAIQEAIEIAQREAKLAKMKQKLTKFNSNNDEVIVNMNMNMTENVVEKEKTEDNVMNNTIQLEVQEEPKKEILNNEIVDNNETIPKLTNILNDTAECKALTPRGNDSQKNYNNNIPKTPKTDYQALIFQSPLEILQNLPYAVLVPNLNPSTPLTYTAIPLIDTSSTSRTENRILTPTQYRNNRKNYNLCDSSTQTDPEYVREKFGNLELTYETRSSRGGKGRRSRADSRIEVEDRPKWGANRPPTRYLKQSEKDLLYQRRKMHRQKVRDDKNSSDESQMGSPRAYRKKDTKRNSRGFWRKDNQYRNVRMYQTEIVPLTSDKDRLYYRQNDEECCCRCDKHKVEILKIEHSPRLPDCVPNQEDREILEKLSNLHNGLLLKQEQWKNSPRTPSLSSSKAN